MLPPSYFRAVGLDELEDIRRMGCLRARPRGNIEGKHFWATLEHARQFARDLLPRMGTERHAIVEVWFADGAAITCFNSGTHDGIGPAWFAEETALHLISRYEIVETSP